MTDQMSRISATPPGRTIASSLLGAATASTVLLSAWLEPAFFPALLHGDTTHLGLALVSLIPLVVSAALWLFRKTPFHVWWLAWVLSAAMTALALVLAISFHALGQAIEADGLIP